MKDGLNSDRDLFCMLDFHGYTVEEARVSINQAFAKAPEEKTREIYIITGRGNHRNADGSHGVLKKALPKLLKPYKKFILEIIEENAAYRIILQKVPLLQPMFDPFLLMAFKMGLNLESYLKMLNTDAEKGDLEAKLELAKLLLSTESGKDRDVKKGILLLQELYEKKSVEACYLLGHIFIEGCEGLDVDYKNGLKYLNEAAAMGSSPAYADLAICYLLGKGVHHSDEKAAEYLKKLADEFNNAWAAAHLGRYYFEGTVVSQDYELAVKYLKIAAKADGSNPGNATSQVYLARCHAMGYGVPRDYKTAYQYYCAAAKQNNVYALHMLGLYSEIGRATPPNLVMAFHFYDRAAVLGDLDSYGRTALFRIHAKGTTRDVEQGLRQLENMVETNHPSACYSLGLIHYSGEIVPKDVQKGLLLIQKGARYKDPEANYWLAKQYFEGTCFVKDPAKGIEHLKISAGRGYAKACSLLGLYLCQGKYLQKDLVQGISYIRSVLDELENKRLIWLVSELSISNTNTHEQTKTDFIVQLVKKVSESCDSDTRVAMADILLDNHIDEAFAETLLNAEIKAGNKEAKRVLGTYYLKQKNDFVKALPLLEEVAIELDDLGIQRWLGGLYLNVQGYQNIQKAIVFLKMAAAHGDPESCWLLGSIYLRDGRNVDEGMPLIRIAAEKKYPIAIEFLAYLHKKLEDEGLSMTNLDENESRRPSENTNNTTTIIPHDKETATLSTEANYTEEPKPNTDPTSGIILPEEEIATPSTAVEHGEESEPITTPRYSSSFCRIW